MLRPWSPWTWALATALVAAAQGCLLDTGPFPAGATEATGGGGGEGGSGGATNTGTATSLKCGNGEKDEGEACDDANTVEGDGCFDCEEDCGCPGCEAGIPCADCDPIVGSVILKDPKTKHCYLYVPALRAHDNARSACQAWAGELVAPSTQSEMKVVADPDFAAVFASSVDPKVVWAGGQNTGTWQWQNMESWKAAPAGPAWGDGSPDPAAGTDCIAFDSKGNILDRSCSEGFPFMCERTPM